MEYQLQVANLTRQLPIIPIDSKTAIASFVLLGDDELSYAAAKALQPKLPTEFDYLVTMESKGIPLAHDLGLLTNHPHSVVLRKSVKGYMDHPLKTVVNSITTHHPQELVLNGNDEKLLQNKRVIIVDDVISTGSSMEAAESLLKQIGVKVVTKVAILAEGAAVNRSDITYLARLPLFNHDGSIKK